jgi:excisionase family DNA binding protein
MTKDIMDVKEIALYLGFSPTKIYRMLTAAQIPYVKVGGQYRFPRQVIDEWLAGKLEVPSSARRTKSTRSTKSARQDQELGSPAPGKPEDGIINALADFRKTGDGNGRTLAKRLMRDHAESLDWEYLASRAKSSDVLDLAISVEKELLREATQ